jgi:hypothetical protein
MSGFSASSAGPVTKPNAGTSGNERQS